MPTLLVSAAWGTLGTSPVGLSFLWSCTDVKHYDFPPPSPREHRERCLLSFSLRGAGIELVVEMQDLLNVLHALAVLGRCLPRASAPNIMPALHEVSPAGTLQRASPECWCGYVKRHAGGELGTANAIRSICMDPH